MIIGQIVDGSKLELDLPTLVDTRLLIQANSGGGKSWLLRLVAERAGIQTIVLDNEGEFASLREAVDVLLVGAGGELTADPRHAALLARRLLEYKVSAVVDLYLDPPDRALVLCVDEKAQIQALDRSQPLLPMRPGQAERRTPDYLRHGTINLFAALDAKAGTVIGEFHQRHRAVEFRNFLATIDAAVPGELELHLILDNYGTHKTPAIKRWLLRHPRFHLHFTPTGGSWLNLVERWFALLPERQLRRGVHRSTRELEDAIRAYLEHHNRHPKPFIWTKTADQILDAVARFCKRISNSGH